MREISLRELLEAGCHFGHQVPRWNPRAGSFIYTARDGVHIIDLAKTKEGLQKAADFIKSIASSGKIIIFLGTKRQARGIVEEETKRAKAMYLITRWPGGLLTNWEQMKKNLDKLLKMRQEKQAGDWEKFTKKEQQLLDKQLAKLEILYGGIADLKSLPEALFIIDSRKEESAVKEALKTGVKTVAMVDTNANPNLIDYPIPANDDAIGSIKLVMAYLIDACIEGQALFQKLEEKAKQKEEKAKVALPKEEPVKVMDKKKTSKGKEKRVVKKAKEKK
jgi:small subunit ribosomal protein S2